MQREAEAILKGRLKEVDHLGDGHHIRREKIKTPDSDTGRGSVTSSKSFSKRRLNSARAHGIRIPHGSPQIFGATGIHNLANLLLAIAWRRKITYWKDLGNHNDRTTEPAARLPRLRILSRLPSMRRPTEREDPEEARMIKLRRERTRKTMKEAGPQANTP